MHSCGNSSPKDAIRPAWWCINPYATEQETPLLAKHAKQRASINQRGITETLRRSAVHTLTCAWHWMSTQTELKSFRARLKRFSCRQTCLTASLFLLFWGRNKVLWNETSAGAMKGWWKNVGKLGYVRCHSISADLRVTGKHTRTHIHCMQHLRKHVFTWRVSDVSTWEIPRESSLCKIWKWTQLHLFVLGCHWLMNW